MSQLTNYKRKNKVDFLVSNDTLIQKSQTKKYKKCSDCKRTRKPSDKNHQICRYCYNYDARKTELLSGNKVIDDFVKHTQVNSSRKLAQKMKFVPYDKFENIEFIAEGGFSKIYKANWIAGECQHVALKKLNNSKNITSKELNEVCTIYNVILIYTN